ncbi:MAG TPA: hypothetical protein DCY79_04145 [Planctomycetaceae bacterium]|nr:hypothetical protein [Blastopirellula sp.]HAY78976.1 hypothetical protein [Planctomycetaceae bacterium]
MGGVGEKGAGNAGEETSSEIFFSMRSALSDVEQSDYGVVSGTRTGANARGGDIRVWLSG